jgi:hypothetical protein
LNKGRLILIAVIGLLIELVTIILLASNRIQVVWAMPLVIVGMMLAFVPIFAVTRRAKRK